MTPPVAAFCAMSIIAGLLLLVAGLRKTPVGPARPPRPLRRRWSAARGDLRTRLLAGAALGLVLFLLTGWVVALPAGPALVVGVPFLLAPKRAASVERLDAMAEWTRTLSGVLTVGVGLEQALIATQRSAPAPIQREVDALVARLRARWPAEQALRAFADDLDDATGDLVAAALILGSRRRGGGLTAVLNGLATSVAAEVRVRRQIEADRAKPRSTARWITLITLGVLGLLTLNGTYMEPYDTPVGQVVLALLLSCYAGALVWLRQVAVGKPAPRFLPADDGGQR